MFPRQLLESGEESRSSKAGYAGKPLIWHGFCYGSCCDLLHHVGQPGLNLSGIRKGEPTMKTTLRNLSLAVCLLAFSAGPALAATIVYEFPLGGDQEVPANDSAAFGVGKLTLDGNLGELELVVVGIDVADLVAVGGMNAPIHIHQGAVGVNGGILVHVPFEFIEGNTLGFVASRSFDFSDQVVELIRAGMTYVNVHTTAFPAGEIRGQIVPLPAGAVLLGSAMLVLGWVRRRQL